MQAGLLIVFEGPEGAGKSTQVALLSQYLSGISASHVVLREPGGTRLGERIRELLLNPDSELVPEAESLLFMASRAELVRCVLRPALQEGKIVLLDRFFLSTYAYQIAGRSLPEEMIRTANALATGGLIPDLTILLSIAAKEGLMRASKRGAGDRMELIGDSFHEKVAQAFREFGDTSWQLQHPECGEVVSINAAQSEQQVMESVLSQLRSRWPATFSGT